MTRRPWLLYRETLYREWIVSVVRGNMGKSFFSKFSRSGCFRWFAFVFICFSIQEREWRRSFMHMLMLVLSLSGLRRAKIGYVATATMLRATCDSLLIFSFFFFCLLHIRDRNFYPQPCRSLVGSGGLEGLEDDKNVPVDQVVSRSPRADSEIVGPVTTTVGPSPSVPAGATPTTTSATSTASVSRVRVTTIRPASEDTDKPTKTNADDYSPTRTPSNVQHQDPSAVPRPQPRGSHQDPRRPLEILRDPAYFPIHPDEDPSRSSDPARTVLYAITDRQLGSATENVLSNHRAYAEKFGYRHVVVTDKNEIDRLMDLKTSFCGDFDPPAGIGLGIFNKKARRCPLQWAKVFGMLEILDGGERGAPGGAAAGSSAFDWLVWLDDDILLTAAHNWLELMKSLMLDQDKHVAVARDHWPEMSFTNTGFMVVRNTEEGRYVLSRMRDLRRTKWQFRNGGQVVALSDHKQTKHDALYEQSALNLLLGARRSWVKRDFAPQILAQDAPYWNWRKWYDERVDTAVLVLDVRDVWVAERGRFSIDTESQSPEAKAVCAAERAQGHPWGERRCSEAGTLLVDWPLDRSEKTIEDRRVDAESCQTIFPAEGLWAAAMWRCEDSTNRRCDDFRVRFAINPTAADDPAPNHSESRSPPGWTVGSWMAHSVTDMKDAVDKLLRGTVNTWAEGKRGSSTEGAEMAADRLRTWRYGVLGWNGCSGSQTVGGSGRDTDKLVQSAFAGEELNPVSVMRMVFSGSGRSEAVGSDGGVAGTSSTTAAVSGALPGATKSPIFRDPERGEDAPVEKTCPKTPPATKLVYPPKRAQRHRPGWLDNVCPTCNLSEIGYEEAPVVLAETQYGGSQKPFAQMIEARNVCFSHTAGTSSQIDVYEGTTAPDAENSSGNNKKPTTTAKGGGPHPAPVSGGPWVWVFSGPAPSSGSKSHTAFQLRESHRHRPTLIVNSDWFGHIYHTWADFYLPLFVTKEILGFSEANIMLFENLGFKRWPYWLPVNLGYEKMAAEELGLHLYPALDKTKQFPIPKFPIPSENVWCVGEDQPVVLGYVVGARPCVHGGWPCRGVDVWRPKVAEIWQRANDRLWRGSVGAAARRVVGDGDGTPEGGRAGVVESEKTSSGVAADHDRRSGTSAPGPSSRAVIQQLLGKEGLQEIESTTTQRGPPPARYHGLFILRSSEATLDATRTLVNRDELVRYYQDHRAKLFPDLEIHFTALEDLKFPDEQRALVSQMTLLLGLHGAGLNWEWWLPPNARIVEYNCADCAFPFVQERHKPPGFYSHVAANLQQPFLHYLQAEGRELRVRSVAHFWRSVAVFVARTGGAAGCGGSARAAQVLGGPGGGAGEIQIDGGGDVGGDEKRLPRWHVPEVCHVVDTEAAGVGRCFAPGGYEDNSQTLVRWANETSQSERERVKLALANVGSELRNTKAPRTL